MTSKERVRAALKRQPVDKTPLGFYLVDCDTISAVIGRPTLLRNHPAFQIALWEGRRDEAVAAMKADLTDFYRKIDCCDLITWKEARMVPPRGFREEDPPRKVDDTTWADRQGNVYKISLQTNGLSQVGFAPGTPDQAANTLEAFSDRTPPEIPDQSCFELLDHLVATFGKDRYIAGYTSGITALTLLGGMEEGMMLLASEPDLIRACNEQKLFRQEILDRAWLRPGIDGVHMEQDFGGTQSPLVSPDMFRDLAYPFLKRRLAQVKRTVPEVLFHSCGSVAPLLDMMIDAGIDALESIQTGARDMELDRLADRFGSRLCLWGNISLEGLIQQGPEQTREEVRRSLRQGRRAPGFILGPSHSIAFGTKYENFMAMLDEFVKLR